MRKNRLVASRSEPPNKSLELTSPQPGAIDSCSLLASINELGRASHRVWQLSSRSLGGDTHVDQVSAGLEVSEPRTIAFAWFWFATSLISLLVLWRRDASLTKKLRWSAIVLLPVLGPIFLVAFFTIPPEGPSKEGGGGL